MPARRQKPSAITNQSFVNRLCPIVVNVLRIIECRISCVLAAHRNRQLCPNFVPELSLPSRQNLSYSTTSILLYTRPLELPYQAKSETDWKIITSFIFINNPHEFLYGHCGPWHPQEVWHIREKLKISCKRNRIECEVGKHYGIM